MSASEKQISTLCRKAERLFADGDAFGAATLLAEAWELLPEPRTSHRLAVTVAGMHGQLKCELEEWEDAAYSLELALSSPGGAQHATTHLRYGQAPIHLDRREEGIDHFVTAHRLGGDKIFRTIEPGYHLLLKERLTGADLSEFLPEELRRTSPVEKPAEVAPPKKAEPAAELSDAVHAEIERLSELGNVAMDEGRYPAAMEYFQQAWSLLSEPRTNWEAGVWLLGALADAAFSLRRYEEAPDYLEQALRTDDALVNPFFHLRRGQALFELGDQQRSMDALMRAYLLAGPEIFGNEDPRYLAALKTVAHLD